MPKNFNINRRLLTDTEKYRRAIFFYTYDDLSFDVIYEDDDNLFDDYGQPLIDVDKNFTRLDDKTKSLVLEYVKREIYDETITLKCLMCNHQEELDWEMVEESWFPDEDPFPISYCPRCSKPKFVPLDIWNGKKKH